MKTTHTVEAWGIETTEFQQRVQKVRAEMRRQKLDALIVYSDTMRIANVAYLANTRGVFRSPGKLLVLPLEGEPMLFTRAGEIPLDQEQVWFETIRPFAELPASLKQLVAKGGVKTIGLERNVVPVELLIPLSLWQLIASAVEEKNVKPVDVVNLVKQVKSPREIELMKQTGVIVDAAVTVMHEALHQRKTEMEVVGLGAAEMMRRGATFSTDMHMGSGPYSATFHKKPGSRSVADGDLAYIDIAPRYYNYCIDICRTFAIGKVSPKVGDLLKVAVEACHAGQAAARPGTTAGELDQAIRKVIATAGYGETLAEHFGHGIGMDPSEPPTIAPGDTWPLVDGMTLSISAKVIAPGTAGVLMENNLIVRPGGGELLSAFDTKGLYVE